MSLQAFLKFVTHAQLSLGVTQGTDMAETIRDMTESRANKCSEYMENRTVRAETIVARDWISPSRGNGEVTSRCLQLQHVFSF